MVYTVQVKLSRTDGVFIDSEENQECAREIVERAIKNWLPKEAVQFHFVEVTSIT